MLDWIGDAATWFGENALAPVVTGTLAGLAVWFAQRWEAIPAEIERHDRAVARINDDLRRYTHDLDGETDRELASLKREWSIYDRLLAIRRRRDLPATWRRSREARKKLEDLREAARRVMFMALWRARDELLRKREEFVEIANSEGPRHARRRRRRKIYHPRMELPPDAAERIAQWRDRDDPFSPGKRLHVESDPTDPTREPVLASLLERGGLDWSEAAEQSTTRTDE
jgi:hypothetical protein